MLKHILSFVGLFFSIQVMAQTGIGTTSPHASAKLEVASENKGFLPPRVTLSNVTDATTIPTPATGLLVYNLGSVGLQAGYYYWNGANWATIATGTTAGNAVVAMDMVKLYSDVYSTAPNKIAHSNGYSFTVPVSGRYLFDFSSSGYVNQTLFTLTFSVRQGTTVLASDFQTSANNNVHVEYNGKLEVNLQSGTTYNVYVNSTGSRDNGDFDRVYYKMVAGNLPVNQHMAERNLQLNNNFISNDGNDEGIRIDNSGNVGIGISSPNASAILDISSTTKGITFPRMTTSQRNAITSPATGLQVFDNTTNSIWYFDGSAWVNSVSVASFGDIKTGFQSTDHNGWIRLNGRLKSSLTATQQTQATALGIGTNLPDASNAFLVQNGNTLGNVTGSNNFTLSRDQLPNITFEGSIINVAHGAHVVATASGLISRVAGNSTGNASGGGVTNNFNLSIPLNGGVTQQVINITPRSLSVNTFIYLGN